MPHKVLTKPAQAFEYFFEGVRKGQQRDHLVKLETTAAGTLNALAIWFDLHLDEEESITTGELLATVSSGHNDVPLSPTKLSLHPGCPSTDAQRCIAKTARHEQGKNKICPKFFLILFDCCDMHS